jgi:hypothetical protein
MTGNPMDQPNQGHESAANDQYFTFMFNIRREISFSHDSGQPSRSFQETMEMVLRGIPIPCDIVEEKFNDPALSIATRKPVKKPWENN